MIKELRVLDKVDHSKAVYIRTLIERKRIKKYVSEKGYVAYDTEELKKYQKNVKIGRPIKLN